MLFIVLEALNSLMSNEKNDNNKCQECDDPCDDCTYIEMSNLTGWITTQKKSIDKQEEE
jgi:hypothetical protein